MGASEMALLLHYVRALPEARRREWGESGLDFPVSLARYEYYSLLEADGKVFRAWALLKGNPMPVRVGSGLWESEPEPLKPNFAESVREKDNV